MNLLFQVKRSRAKMKVIQVLTYKKSQTKQIIVKNRGRIGFSIFLVFFITGLLIGYFGLLAQNQHLTLFSAIMLVVGILMLFTCTIYPFRKDAFWFSHVLQRLGRLGWLRKLEISQYSEGAVNLTLLQIISSVYIWLIVGGSSYLFNDVSTIVFDILTVSWLYVSAHLHFNSLKNLVDLSGIIKNDQRSSFEGKIHDTIDSLGKISKLFLILGAFIFVVLTTFWTDPRDLIPQQLTFYVQNPWTDPPVFAMAYPHVVIPYYTIKIVGGLAYGVVGVMALLVITTTLILMWLTSDKVQATIDIYDPDCIKPAERLLNTFWLLIGAGLARVPYLTALSLNLQKVGAQNTANWSNYLVWTYIVFFVGILFFSMAKYFSFVSSAKNSADREIRRELETMLRRGADQKTIAPIKLKMQLLASFRSRPTLTTFLQLVQIIAIIALNQLINILGNL